MKIDTATKYLEPLSYEATIAPVGSKLPSGSYALESSVPEIADAHNRRLMPRRRPATPRHRL